jgi:FixJ family two-component response regulator
MRIAGGYEMSCDFVVHIVDNDAAILDALRLLLATEGYAVRTHQSARRFLDTIQQDDCGCVVAEMHMPEMGGMGLLAALNERGSSMPVIIITANGDVPLAVATMKQGAFDYLKKPLDGDNLLVSIHAAFDAHINSELACPAS